MKKRLLLVLALLFLVAAGCGQNRDQVRGGNQAPKELVLAPARIMEITAPWEENWSSCTTGTANSPS